MGARSRHVKWSHGYTEEQEMTGIKEEDIEQENSGNAVYVQVEIYMIRLHF